MATGSTAVVVAGTVMSYIGNKQAAEDQEAAARIQAENKRLQAKEMLERFELNKEEMLRTEKNVIGQQLAAYSKSGVDVGSGAALAVMEDTNRKIQRQIRLEKREAEFKAEQLYRGADIDLSLAGDISKASKIQNIGIFLRGASSAYRTYNT